MTKTQQPDRRANHLRAWREYRGLTQAQLAAVAGTQRSVIGLLESGDRSLSDRWLQRLAVALRTTPGLLMDCSPDMAAEAMTSLEDCFPINTSSEVASPWPRSKVVRRPDIDITHDARVDPGYDIPELWWKIPDEDKPAALAALKALIPRH